MGKVVEDKHVMDSGSSWVNVLGEQLQRIAARNLGLALADLV